jgi:polar amino acid transport system permease protein
MAESVHGLHAGELTDLKLGTRRSWTGFPYWLLIILMSLGMMVWVIATQQSFADTFRIIIGGIGVTLRITGVTFVAASLIGMFVGLGRVSRNVIIRNLATTYVEFIRGVPMVVLVLMLAFVLVPLGSRFLGFSNTSVSAEVRFIVSLTIIYGAFLAEIFRAGIESIPPGQTEAARSLGMRNGQVMRFVVLPQAVRNVLPALGNDLIAVLKDSAFATLLGVRDITQSGRLYQGRTFRTEEVFLILTFLYLTMTMCLSLLVQWYQRRLRRA